MLYIKTDPSNREIIRLVCQGGPQRNQGSWENSPMQINGLQADLSHTIESEISYYPIYM